MVARSTRGFVDGAMAQLVARNLSMFVTAWLRSRVRLLMAPFVFALISENITLFAVSRQFPLLLPPLQAIERPENSCLWSCRWARKRRLN